VFDGIGADQVGAVVGVLSFGAAVVTILQARKPSLGALPPEIPLAARARYLTPRAEWSGLAALPAEIEEKIFLADDTPSTIEDDIAAREAGITFLEGQLAEARTAGERMPIRRHLRVLQTEIAALERGAEQPQTMHGAAIRKLSSSLDPAWSVMYKLPPLGRRTRPWLAAVIGFVAGGIGLSLYFRKWVDVLILVAMVIAAVLVGYLVEGSWWVGAAFAAVYGFIRAESSNRRLAFQERSGVAVVSAQAATS
jgi:hypothetical protein